MKLGFSSRLPEDLSDSPFFLQLSALKRKVGTWTDLTVSTPLSAGIPFDLDSVLSAASGNFSVWNPDSSGWLQTQRPWRAILRNGAALLMWSISS